MQVDDQEVLAWAVRTVNGLGMTVVGIDKDNHLIVSVTHSRLLRDDCTSSS